MNSPALFIAAIVVFTLMELFILSRLLDLIMGPKNEPPVNTKPPD